MVFWAVVIGVRADKSLVLVKKGGGNWIFNWREWEAEQGVEKVKELLENNYHVYVQIDYERRAVLKVNYSLDVRGKGRQAKTEEAVKSEEGKQNSTAIFIGKKVESDMDRVALIFFRKNGHWQRVVRVWGPYPAQSKPALKMWEFEDGGFEKKTDAIRSAVQLLKSAVAELVLGHDLTNLYPEEDVFSRRGRDWLLALKKVSLKYLNTDLVNPISVPAGVRFTTVSRGKNYIFFTNSVKNVAKVLGDVREIHVAKFNMDESPVLWKFRIQADKLFVIFDGHQFNLLHLCAVLEEVTGMRFLGVKGHFLKDVVGKEFRVLAYPPKNGYLVIPYRKEKMNPALATLVGEEGYFILPSIGGRAGNLSMTAERVDSAGAENYEQNENDNDMEVEI